MATAALPEEPTAATSSGKAYRAARELAGIQKAELHLASYEQLLRVATLERADETQLARKDAVHEKVDQVWAS